VPTAPGPELRVRTGIDVVGIERLRRLVEGDDERQREVFTPGELEYCRRKRRQYDHMAARFAAKEAVLKAFGTGISQRMRWTDVEVVSESSGRPRIVLDGAVAAFAERHGLRDLDVSLTHTEGLAVAQAITLWERGSACAST
jgi:holo-[acyl-carrier protein] synthase